MLPIFNPMLEGLDVSLSDVFYRLGSK